VNPAIRLRQRIDARGNLTERLERRTMGGIIMILTQRYDTSAWKA